MQLDEFYGYKNLLMKELCSNEQVVKLVTGSQDAAVPNHGLPYTQVYPFEFVPETVGEGKTYICFDIDILSVPNKTYYIPVLYIWIFTHKSLLRMPDGSGCLLDRLSAEVNQMLNGSRRYGLGEFRLDNTSRFSPVTDYLGRELTYYGVDLNRPKGYNKFPTNRKEEQR